jgi:hypothetical protein
VSGAGGATSFQHTYRLQNGCWKAVALHNYLLNAAFSVALVAKLVGLPQLLQNEIQEVEEYLPLA